jgi:acyl carrier protein
MTAVPLDPAGFLHRLADTLEPAATLAPDRPLGDQLAVDSARLMELAIVLEQDLGMRLPDDVDLRALTPAGLYADYRAGR